jgi:membrane fusion protein (multidrug efflux system)
MKQSIIASLIVIACCIVSCKDDKEKKTVVPEVNVVKVGQKSVPLYSEFVGQTYGQSDVEIRPRSEGWVESLNFKEGNPVKRGQLLYVIQDDELRDRLQAAEARLTESKVLLVKAKSDLDRVKPLVEMNALSKRDLDAAQATYDAQIESVRSSEALLHNSQIQYSYSRITAPISGYIGISKVQVGDYVSKGLGQPPINTVSSLGQMRVRFAITENDYLNFKQKLPADQLRHAEVQLILNDGTIFPETAKLDFANREVDAATGSMLVQALVSNKDGVLRPGQYVKVRFQTDLLESSVLVPQNAINQMQSMYVAYLVNDSNKVQSQPVKVGPRVGSNWIIETGLKPGQKVALIGNAIIRPGMEVKPVDMPYSYDSTSNSK